MKRDVLFTHILFVKTVHTNKLLQSEMLIVDQQDDSTDCKKHACGVVALALSLVYIYTAVGIT